MEGKDELQTQNSNILVTNDFYGITKFIFT